MLQRVCGTAIWINWDTLGKLLHIYELLCSDDIKLFYSVYIHLTLQLSHIHISIKQSVSPFHHINIPGLFTQLLLPTTIYYIKSSP